MTPANATLWGTVGNNSARIRTSDLNANVSSASLSLAFFTTKLVQVSSNFTTSLVSVSASLNAVIQDVCFGSTVHELYVLILESKLLNVASGKAYAILFYNGTQLKNKVFLYEIDPSSNTVDEFLCSNGRIVLLFTSTLEVYPVANFTLGPVMTKLTYSNTPETNLDVEMTGDTLTFSINNRLYLYNMTGQYYTLEYNFTKDTIRSVTRIPQSCYVVVKMDNTITQFDYCIGQPIHVFNFKGDNKQKVGSFGLTSFGVYVDLVGTYPKLYTLFNVTSEYPCSACTCLDSYQYNGTTLACVKNTTIPYVAVPINETVNLTNFPVAQSNTTPFNESLIIPKQITTQVYSQLIQKLLPDQSTKAIGAALIATSLKISPNSLFIFAIFLNDLWYYKFHRKQNPEYPNSTKVFMNKVDLIKSFQLNPDMLIDYLPFTASSSNTSQLYERNTRLSQQLELDQDAPDKVYFLYSTEEVYKNSAIMAVFFFAAMKVVHLLLYLARNKAVLLLKLYKFVRAQSRWWSLLTGIIEANGVMLGFCSGLQMELFSAQDMADKLNLFYMTFMLFCLVFYATAFYLLVGVYQRKRKESASLLVYTKASRKSLFFQPVIILARSFIKSFFHSYFLGVYSTQIALLFIVDLVFVLFSLSIRKCYRNANVFFFLTAYLVGFMVFDLYFLLEEHQVIAIASDADRELYGFILCCMLAFVSILLSLSVQLITIRDLYKTFKGSLKKKNTQQLKKEENQKRFDRKIQEFQGSKFERKNKNAKPLSSLAPSKHKKYQNKIVPKDKIQYEYDEQRRAYKFKIKMVPESADPHSQPKNKQLKSNTYNRKYDNRLKIIKGSKADTSSKSNIKGSCNIFSADPSA